MSIGVQSHSILRNNAQNCRQISDDQYLKICVIRDSDNLTILFPFFGLMLCLVTVTQVKNKKVMRQL